MNASKIAPCLWFDGQAEEAAKFYVSLFPDSRIDQIARYGEATSGVPVNYPKGTAWFVDFTLAGQRFQALNGGPQYQHTGAISFSISCRDAAEVDRFWGALTANGGTEVACGWLTDRFGVTWQVVPDGLSELVTDRDPKRARRALEAMFTMKKLDLTAMRKAADGG